MILRGAMWKRKKKSPTSVIEKNKHLELEDVWAKTPGKMKKLSGFWARTPYGIIALKSLPKKPYSRVHTHPLPSKITKEGLTVKSALAYVYGKAHPSQADIESFATSPLQKTEIIAQVDPVEGIVQGYVFLKKTSKYDSNMPTEEKVEMARILGNYNGKDLNELTKKYGINTRYVPVKGYKFSTNRDKFVKEGKLEKVASTMAIIGIGGSLFFLSPNITGNVIGNLVNTTSNIVGVSLLVVGLVAGFFWLKSKKR